MKIWRNTTDIDFHDVHERGRIVQNFGIKCAVVQVFTDNSCLLCMYFGNDTLVMLMFDSDWERVRYLNNFEVWNGVKVHEWFDFPDISRNTNRGVQYVGQ